MYMVSIRTTPQTIAPLFQFLISKSFFETPNVSPSGCLCQIKTQDLREVTIACLGLEKNPLRLGSSAADFAGTMGYLPLTWLGNPLENGTIVNMC